jgi:phage shock protein PspC (stress-responsive transcriptional regulator)
MTDEAAESRGPATTGAGPSQEPPAPSASPTPPSATPPSATPPSLGTYDEPTVVIADTPPVADDTPPVAAAPPPPPPGADVPPPPPGAGPQPPPNPPPWFGADPGPEGRAFFSRQLLVRPAEGRYVGGVCAAIGRATNTDPVLWRVVIAVLGFFGGIGILIYLIGWLAIPGEGDTGSPLESLLGRGNSQMSPMSVLLLGLAAALTFAFIVNDGFRAALLAAAVLVGGVVMLRRNNAAKAAGGGTPGAAFPPPPAGPAAGPQSAYAAPSPPAGGWAPPGQPASAAPPAGKPMTAPLPPRPPAPPYPGTPPTAGTPFGPPPGAGYRPPFAPHGPWAGQPPYPPGFAPPLPKPGPAPRMPRPPKPPKPPRERSKLGRITFFMIPLALGLVALLDQAGVSVEVSTYFAAALATIALGLVVGAWFGRARGLIALALLATIGLGVSSAGERWGGPLRDTYWRPVEISAVADRYETPVGDATLDLRQVDFTGQKQATAIRMGGGRLQVMLPPTVDVTINTDVDLGSSSIFGQRRDGANGVIGPIVNLGVDGAGGGELQLDIRVDAGNVEVTR